MNNWHWLEDEEYYKRFDDISKKQYEIDCARGSSALAIKGSQQLMTDLRKVIFN